MSLQETAHILAHNGRDTEAAWPLGFLLLLWVKVRPCSGGKVAGSVILSLEGYTEGWGDRMCEHSDHAPVSYRRGRNDPLSTI